MGIIAVLGTGPSLSLYSEYPETFDASIGVNDICKFVNVTAVVCLNSPGSFTPDRLRYIQKSKPDAFYSQMVAWDTRKDFKKINLIPGYPDNFVQLDTPAFHKSYCSPFVACEIAYKYYGATEIHLFGVDLVNHPLLDKKLCQKIKNHFRNLRTALDPRGCKLIIHGQGILAELNQPSNNTMF